MASAEVKYEHVKHPVEVTLTLTMEEAEFLASLTDYIGGDPNYSPRKHSDSIWSALMAVGVYGKNLPRAKGAQEIIFTIP